MNRTKKFFEQIQYRLPLIIAWIAVGAVALYFSLTALTVGYAVYISVRYPDARIFSSYSVSYSEFYEHKEDFELISDIASRLFAEEYEQNDKLISIELWDTTAFYYYSDPEYDKTVNFTYSDEIKESFKSLHNIFYTGKWYGGLSHIIANGEQVIFARDNGYQASVVYNNSIFRPKTLKDHIGESKVHSTRLSLDWFQCIELENVTWEIKDE